MVYGSVCSGIEAATEAWHVLGWSPAWFAEIDPFASAVLAHRHPSAINVGDFTAIGAERGPIDLLVGGTPCQSFSVAGQRAGLDDPRGNLALEFLRLAQRVRARWVVWENVPGVLSSGGGRDFGAVLGGLAELGYGFAYRVLDAQFFGVPQRRRRVFVVGHLGDWRRAAAVLFERASLSWDPPPRRAARESVAASLTRGADSSGRGSYAGRRAEDDVNLVAGTLGAMRGGWSDDFDRSGAFIPEVARCVTADGERRDGERRDGESDTFVARPLLSKGNLSHDESQDTLVAHTLRGDGFDASEDGTGRGTPLAFHITQDPISGRVTPAMSSGNGEGCAMIGVAYQCHGTNVGEAGTLRRGQGGVTGGVPFIVNSATSGAKRDHARESETARCLDGTGGFASGQGGTAVIQTGPTYSLGSHAGAADAEASNASHAGGGPTGMGVSEEVSHSLRAGRTQSVAAAAVRRLTPRECERLQGFPDDYTLVPYNGKPAADGPRYRAIGNSMAVPVMRWIGQRIQRIEDLA